MKQNKTISPVLACTLLVLAVSEAHADAWQKEPSFGVELGFNDNYTLQPEPENANADRKIQEVTTLKAKAGFALIQLKPAYTARIEGKLIATSYSGDADGYLGDDPNSTDPDAAKVMLGAQLEDRVDAAFDVGIESRRERAFWRLDAALLTDSLLQDISLDATQGQNNVDTDNQDNDDGTVRDNVDRTRLTITPSYQYQLSPISFFRTSLSISSAEYDNTEFTDLKDYDEQKLAGFFSKEFSPVNSWTVDGEVRNYEAGEAGQFDSQILGFGILHKFSETTDLGLRLAQSSTSFDYGNTSGRTSKPLVQLTGSKSTGRTIYSLRMGTDLYGSATGDVVRADELLFNAVYQYSELMTLTWRSKLFQNKSLRDFIAEDGAAGSAELLEQQNYNDGINYTNRRYLAFEPTINWRFSRWWVLDGGLRYQREKRDSLGNPGESTYAFVGVTYSKPIGVQPEY